MYKVCCVIAGVVLLLPFWVFAQSAPPATGRSLAAMRDHFRPLLIFYPKSSDRSPSGNLLERQRVLFETAEADLNERDVVLTFVPSVEGHEIHAPDTDSALRQRFHVDGRRFTVILLGKDGDEKFRSHEPVTIEKLNALIDAMPMRQQEMRDGHHSE